MKRKQMKCLLCNENAIEVHDSYTGYQLPHKFEIYSCDRCNTSFPMPRVNAGKIYDIIYKGGKNHPGYRRYFKFAEGVKATSQPLTYLENMEPTYFAIAEFFRQKHIRKGSSVLEVGSGLGYLTYALNKEGFITDGLDLSAVAVKDAKQNFGDFYLNADLYEYSKKNTSTYDVVVSTEVIEHVENPVSFISGMVNLLKPGGSLILTSPNKSFFPKGMIWESSLPPIHCWWFSEDSFRTIGDILDLSVEFVSFEKYFSKSSPLIWSKDACINRPAPEAILDEGGAVLNNTLDGLDYKVGIKRWLINRMLDIKFIKNIYLAIKRNKETYVVAGEKCHYMGAVFTKR